MSRNETSLTLFNWNTVRERFILRSRKKILNIPLNTIQPTTLVKLGDGDPIETGNTASRSLRSEFGDSGSIASPNLRRSDPNPKCFHRNFNPVAISSVFQKKYSRQNLKVSVSYSNSINITSITKEAFSATVRLYRCQ